ncbi:MAG: dTDP-4-amino-4,6-dideoxygalactose transaminase [Spirochaetaceae bacterium]|jgi:dTDP-4-amino-4,6-dideoxygalactose transaminase|nr:dTDP-4-amino-4,6-dideoxygalactose transaminase [Spirochaetaceae bacterium]
MIPFNVPPVTGKELAYIEDVIHKGKLCGDGEYTKKCHAWFEKNIPAKKVLLTTSCTHALEMTAFLLDIKAGDEVIMPSYTFVSTANAFAIRGAKIIFVDIDPTTMNIDHSKIERAITKKTKAIIPVHYAGVSCDMDAINTLADKRDIAVIEDAAQSFMSGYKGKNSGSLGKFGCYSFHETKNISCGEGGLLIINDEKYIEQAEIIREKGTNRSRFLRGVVDKYTWVNKGSSYLPSELNAAYLFAQLENSEIIQKKRIYAWNLYMEGLKDLENSGYIMLPHIPENVTHNAHMFYVKTKDIEERCALMNYLKIKGIGSAFHYIPLHNSSQGKKCGSFLGTDKWTTRESERLLRLPLWYGITPDAILEVVDSVISFYKINNENDFHKKAYYMGNS